MKKKRTLTVVAMVLAVLLLGVGYAATIGNIQLNITGNATATPDSNLYVVKFTAASETTPIDSKKSYINVDAKVDSDLEGTINVTGMKTKGDSVTVQYTIANESEDLSAALSVDLGDGTSDKFTITPTLGTELLAKDSTTTLTVVITLNETPISGDLTTSIPVTVTAVPTTPTSAGA